MMNSEAFNSLYEFYKENFYFIESLEEYKWEAVQQFHKCFSLKAKDFTSMIENSLSKARYVMDGLSYCPCKKIIWAARRDPEKVREMFRVLFDESKNVVLRKELFVLRMDDIIALHSEEGYETGDQDNATIMFYLSAQYPEKYYLYRYNTFSNFNAAVGYAPVLPFLDKWDRLRAYKVMCDDILSFVLKDEELLRLYEYMKNKYCDPEYHLLVYDLIYSVQYYNEPDLLQFDQEKQLVEHDFTLKANDRILGAAHNADNVKALQQYEDIKEMAELFVFRYEQRKVKSYGIGKKVHWISREVGNNEGYNILSYDEGGQEIYISVKPTLGEEADPIIITNEELRKSNELQDRYRLYRIYNFDLGPETGEISVHYGSLDEYCKSPLIYKAEFN